MCQIQATGYGTVTDEVRHDRNCSSSALYTRASTNAEDFQDLNAKIS